MYLFGASCPAIRQVLQGDECLFCWESASLLVWWGPDLWAGHRPQTHLLSLIQRAYRKENSAQTIPTNLLRSILLHYSTGWTFHTRQVTVPITLCSWDFFHAACLLQRRKAFILLSQSLSRRQNPLSSISVLDGLAKPTGKRLTCNLLSASIASLLCPISCMCSRRLPAYRQRCIGMGCQFALSEKGNITVMLFFFLGPPNYLQSYSVVNAGSEHWQICLQKIFPLMLHVLHSRYVQAWDSIPNIRSTRECKCVHIHDACIINPM